MKHKVAIPALLTAVAIAVAAYNWITVHGPLQSVINRDPRDQGLSVWAYHHYGILPSEIVFDLRDVSPTNSAADVTRVLLQFAEAEKDSRFDRVYLAHESTIKFMLDGAYFQRLGQEYESQNPVYTLRTLPENVFTPDGSRAFETWTGGILGVLNAQLGDLNTFHRRWFIDDLAGH